MQTFGSVASVIAAIREEAAADVERIEQQTEAEATRRRNEAAAADVSVADRAEQLSAARRLAASELAQIEWEGRCAVIEQREAWIADVARRATERRAADRSQLTNLAREALGNLPPLPCAITVAQRDTVIADDAWCAELARLTGKPSVTVRASDSVSGGCVATAGDVTFDNSIEARSRRLESQWRFALSNLYTVSA